MNDTQLKQALAKMLPDALIWDVESSQHNTVRDEGWGLCWDSGNPVLDTELLHLCWLVEKELDWDSWHAYKRELDKLAGEREKISAIWQQRTILLAKVKGIEII